MNKKLGVAVWGVGEHAQRNILPAITSFEPFRLVGLLSRNTNVLNEQQNKFDCKIWTSPEDMLSDGEVDVVYVATPVAYHYEHAMQVLISNKHLLCEKLLTDSIEKTTQLINYSKKNKLVLCEMLMYQYHPQFLKLKKWLNEDKVGRIKSITARFGFPHLESSNHRYNSQDGGGALFDACVYPLSAVLALIDQAPEFICSSVQFNNKLKVDTAGSAMIKFNSNTTAFIEWCFGCSYRNEIEIWGEKGSIYVERAFSKPSTYSPKLIFRNSDNTVEEENIPACNHFIEVFKIFANAFISKKTKDMLCNTSSELAKAVEIINQQNKPNV